ncbi:MAG: hypothetical protein ACOCVF_01815, partial [bacterium]
DKLILVYYISVDGIRTEDIQDYMKSVSDRIAARSLDVAEIIFIPIHGETRVECINPLYITEEELIRKHRLLMDELHEHVNYQIKLTKKGKSDG